MQTFNIDTGKITVHKHRRLEILVSSIPNVDTLIPLEFH